MFLDAAPAQHQWTSESAMTLRQEERIATELGTAALAGQVRPTAGADSQQRRETPRR